MAMNASVGHYGFRLRRRVCLMSVPVWTFWFHYPVTFSGLCMRVESFRFPGGTAQWGDHYRICKHHPRYKSVVLSTSELHIWITKQKPRAIKRFIHPEAINKATPPNGSSGCLASGNSPAFVFSNAPLLYTSARFSSQLLSLVLFPAARSPSFLKYSSGLLMRKTHPSLEEQ